MSSDKATTTRDFALDALKVIAITCIVFHHYQQDAHVVFDQGLNFYEGFFPFAYFVELFFMLSGLFMYRYIPRIGTQYTFVKFYLKRALRLLPIVAIAAVAFEMLVVIYPLLSGQLLEGHTLDIWGMIIDALGVQAGWFFENPHVNNPTWYVSVLLLCYALFYLATWIANKVKINPNFLYAGIIIVGIIIGALKLDLPFLNGLAQRGYISFFFGLLLGQFLTLNLGKSLGVKIGALAIVGCVLFYLYRHPDFRYVQYLLVFFFFPSVIILFKTNLAASIFRFKWIETLSKLSFDVYVWHDMLFYVIALFGLTTGISLPFNNYFFMLGFGVASFAVGALSYYFLETPIANWLKKNTTLLN